MHLNFFKTWVLILSFIALPAFAQGRQSKSIFLGGGLISRNAGKAASNATSADKPLFGEVYGQISAMGFYKLTRSWALSPDFHYALPSKSSPEGGSSTSLMSFGLRTVRKITSSLDFHVGPGLLFYKISGSGGTVTLRNGSGTTDFGLPSGSSTSQLVYIDLGIGLAYSRFRLDGSLLVTGFMSSSKRALSPLVTLSVGLY